MRKEREGWTYPAYRLRPDRALAAKYLEAQGAPADLAAVPLTYMIFLRGEGHGVDLFKDLDIPRDDRAVLGGDRGSQPDPRRRRLREALRLRAGDPARPDDDRAFRAAARCTVRAGAAQAARRDVHGAGLPRGRSAPHRARRQG